MNRPTISVLLPVFNSAAYLKLAIQSVIDQQFSDFELIIINDGSTDNCEQIINSFTDSRIIYHKNKTNKGLIYSLNFGINISKGKYIARMDADDISHSKRFYKQVQFLNSNNKVAVVATTITFINESGELAGNWQLDLKTILPNEIKKTMPFQNCIAHPSIMIRTEIAKENLYNINFKNIEDYELWLRLLNKNYSIAKLNENLLYYRLHQHSITNLYLKNSTLFLSHFRMKLKFLKSELFNRKINFFTFMVFVGAIIDLAKGCFKWIKFIFSKHV